MTRARRALGRTLLAAALALATLGAACEGGRAEASHVPVPGGDAARGRLVIQEIGCGACHTIPGIRSADGMVGPPLTSWARRSYIAGNLPNAPENLVRWIVDAPSVEPGTAMPDLDVTPDRARDVAAYLYTLR